MEEDVYHLSPGELEAVTEGIWQIENGFCLTHEEAKKRIREVLNKSDVNSTDIIGTDKI